MEDQEIRILPTLCDMYMTSKETDANTQLESPLSVLLNTFPAHQVEKEGAEFCESYEDIASQTIITKLYASVFEKRVWKRRLLIITNSMVLVIKRPDDHYLKGAFKLKDMKEAIALVPKKEVRIIEDVDCRMRAGLSVSRERRVIFQEPRFSLTTSMIY